MAHLFFLKIEALRSESVKSPHFCLKFIYQKEFLEIPNFSLQRYPKWKFLNRPA